MKLPEELRHWPEYKYLFAWLKVATKGLSDESRARVRQEVEVCDQYKPGLAECSGGYLVWCIHRAVVEAVGHADNRDGGHADGRIRYKAVTDSDVCSSANHYTFCFLE